MKKILGTIKTRKNQVESIEFLTSNEMLAVRGGTEPIKPSSRPIESFPFED